MTVRIPNILILLVAPALTAVAPTGAQQICTSSLDFDADPAGQPLAAGTIIDMLGRTVETLVDRHVSSGAHAATWDADGRATGTYLIRLETDTGTSTRTVVLLK